MAQATSEQTVELLQETAGSGQLAIVLVDRSGREVLAANNNSICSSLNPGGEFSPACRPFCGSAVELVGDSTSPISFECHAGLECRAARVTFRGQRLVAIAGRAFTKTENYRRSTERAVSGQMGDLDTAELFDNVLIAGSTGLIDASIERIQARFPVVDDIDRTSFDGITDDDITADELLTETKAEPTVETPANTHRNAMMERFDREVRKPEISQIVEDAPHEEIAETAVEQPLVVHEQIAISEPPVAETTEPTAIESKDTTGHWRSFYGTLLDKDLQTAADELLDNLSNEFELGSIIWLERKGSTFAKLAGRGELAGLKVKLGIKPDDPRLVSALASDAPIEMREKPRSADNDATARSMTLFPMGLAGKVSAAVASLGPIVEPEAAKRIVHICRTAASHFEILRLRDAVIAREDRGLALRKFSESLRNGEETDPWMALTQNAAEILEAEKASILIFDERQNTLVVRSMIGRADAPSIGDTAGERVASLVYERGEPALVADVATTKLPSLDEDRGYQTASFLSCPIVFGTRTLGVMNFTDRIGNRVFDKRSYEDFRAIASQIALAADRALLKEKAGEFEQLSVTDALTGLLNRRYIEARLSEEVKRSNRDNTPMSLLLLDVDHFKSYNDQFGHPAGDSALITVGKVIKDTLRGADVASRYGGEEFAILLPTTSGDEAMAIAERIRYNIERTDFSHRNVTVSIGAASCSSKLCVVGDLVDAADKALYRAKERGRNQVVAFEQMAPKAGDRAK